MAIVRGGGGGGGGGGGEKTPDGVFFPNLFYCGERKI